EYARLDTIALHGQNGRFHAADLNDRDVLFGNEPKVAQRDARARIDGSAEAADAQRFTFELFGFFNFRTHHQVLHESIDGRTEDRNVASAQGSAHRGAAGDLQKLNLPGD